MRTREQRQQRKAHLQALKQIRYADPVRELTKHAPRHHEYVEIGGNGDMVRNPHYGLTRDVVFVNR